MTASAPVRARTSRAFSARIDVAVRRHGQRDGSLDLADRVVLDRADEAALARAAMDRQRGNARVFGDPGDPDRIAVFAAPAGANLQRHRHTDCGDDRRNNGGDQRFVLQQRRAGGDVAHLLRRAAHVDVDDLRATIDVIARGSRPSAPDPRQRSARRWVRLRRDDRCVAAISPWRATEDPTRPSPTRRVPHPIACRVAGKDDR